ncbi:MAG: DAK2 domain-containing protein [Truepera sp.]|nr:DAK2 domain-containing protein [Truepera sp.]
MVNAEPMQLKPRELVGAVLYATDWLGVYIEEVNALNVYPVPDGDTGTNMHLTMQSVRRQMHEDNPRTMAEFARALAYGSLLGARGNSGVILSQILKGFAEAIRECDSLDAPALVRALQEASKTAYAAVMKPVEGTILTVIRRAAEGAAEKGSSLPLAVLRDAIEAGRVALDETPELLPILKQAGVVDAGGLGLLYILEGLVAAHEGRDLPAPPKITRRAQEQFEEQEFGFCTEFLLSDVKVPTRDIQEVVKEFGDSLLVVGAEGYVKGHIHTEEPEKLLATVARFGKMVRSKVEDMSEQHSEILESVEMAAAEPPKSALVAVSMGYGITKVFRSLGARVVGGGQTNNPSVQDIADAVRSVGARNVIILPNNKNVIMTAERVAELIPDKAIKVLPTRGIGQGLAAAVLHREDAELDELYRAMREAYKRAVTLEITSASRDASVNGVAVKEGDTIGLVDGELKLSAKSSESAVLALLQLTADEMEIATVFYSPAVGEERAQRLCDEIAEKFSLELELHPGAPDLYDYVIALE